MGQVPDGLCNLGETQTKTLGDKDEAQSTNVSAKKSALIAPGA